jgi:hypothetical protein
MLLAVFADVVGSRDCRGAAQIRSQKIVFGATFAMRSIVAQAGLQPGEFAGAYRLNSADLRDPTMLPMPKGFEMRAPAMPLAVANGLGDIGIGLKITGFVKIVEARFRHRRERLRAAGLVMGIVHSGDDERCEVWGQPRRWSRKRPTRVAPVASLHLSPAASPHF